MFQKVAFTMYPVKDMARARVLLRGYAAIGPGQRGSIDARGSSSTCPAAAAFAITDRDSERAERERRRQDRLRG